MRAAALILALLGVGVAARLVRDCRDRIGVVITPTSRRQTRFATSPGNDLIVGPVALAGLRQYARDWSGVVDEEQASRSFALLGDGDRVTLEVPSEQRAWMRIHGRAPRQGRCAELIVWTAPDAARRARLFPELC